MTKLVTGAQMARIDQRAIQSGILGAHLMETAGQGAAQVLQGLLKGFRGKNIVILCGKGNNGGDGFVVARLAVAAGASVSTFLFAPINKVKDDARFHLDRATKNGIRIQEVFECRHLDGLKQALATAHVVVDALLGTGIRGGPRGLIANAISELQKTSCPILAIDVPSGLDADTGRVQGLCAKATCTVTFGQPKIGQFFYPGRLYCGILHCVDIGLPAAAVCAEAPDVNLISSIAGLLPQRAPDAHKGDCGRVVILAGSLGLTGAATLCAQAALRAGAGLVTVGIPESLNPILEVKLTEAMTYPLPEVRKPRCLALRARGEIKRLISTARCVALGPGLGTHRETVELVKRLVQDIPVPLVLDADGLNALAGEVGRLQSRPAPTVITPHPGEFSRLTGLEITEIRANPLQAARNLAAQLGLTVVLKGAPTLVATAEKTYVNPSGNAGMATGGTGDVLTGIIAALIGQGLSTEDAACLGVYLHGLAGDLAAQKTGQPGLIAGDLTTALPDAEQAAGKGTDLNRYIRFHTKPGNQIYA